VAQKINVALPEDVGIGDGWTVEWDAVDPSTGASVAGVIVSDANVTADDTSSGGGTGGFESGPFMLVPGPDA
jgi:hypothetical protein